MSGAGFQPAIPWGNEFSVYLGWQARCLPHFFNLNYFEHPGCSSQPGCFSVDREKRTGFYQ
jgi:hypothetical protein